MLFVEARELPMFDLSLTFAAGSSQDGNTPGIAVLTNAMLNEGVAGKDVSAIAQGFEGLGAAFGNGAYRDMAITSLRSLSDKDKRTPALNLFAEVVGKPTFPADSLARIKNQLLAGFEVQKQNPGKLASNELFSRLYGNHPYAHPTDGSAQSISAITLDQIKAFHNKTYTAGNAVIAIVGDLSRAEAEAMASQVSAALPKGPAVAKIAEPVEPKAGVNHIEFPSKQTHLLLAQLGVGRDDPDYPALLLVGLVALLHAGAWWVMQQAKAEPVVTPPEIPEMTVELTSPTPPAPPVEEPPPPPPPLPTSRQRPFSMKGITLRLSSKWRDTISSGLRTAVRL